MQTLSGLSGRLSQGESDFTLPPGGSSEGRVGLILPLAKNIVNGVMSRRVSLSWHSRCGSLNGAFVENRCGYNLIGTSNVTRSSTSRGQTKSRAENEARRGQTA